MQIWKLLANKRQIKSSVVLIISILAYLPTQIVLCGYFKFCNMLYIK